MTYFRPPKWMTFILAGVTFVGSTRAENQPADTVGNRPVPLVFDTDIGNDIDDALALGVIHALECRGECELKAVTVTKDHPMSAAFVDVINNFYGRAHIPIGVVHGGPTPEPSSFTTLADKKDGDHWRYPHKLMSGSQAPDAVGVLRKALSTSPDGSVVVVQVGASTNLARLLDSAGDSSNSLSGIELVKKKVRLLSIMAGSFVQAAGTDGKPFGEYNVKIDLPAAKTIVSRWPTPIVFSGYEIGSEVTFPAISIDRDFGFVRHHPLAEAYRLYAHMPYDRPSWDLTSVLYAVRPDRDYFTLSPPGTVSVGDDASTTFKPGPTGKHRYLTLNREQSTRVREALVQLASQPPCERQPALEK